MFLVFSSASYPRLPAQGGPFMAALPWLTVECPWLPTAARSRRKIVDSSIPVRSTGLPLTDPVMPSSVVIYIIPDRPTSPCTTGQFVRQSFRPSVVITPSFRPSIHRKFQWMVGWMDGQSVRCIHSVISSLVCASVR